MTEFVLNPLVDKYLVDGCMRCKYGATPQCKVIPWQEHLEMLRQIVLECNLKEEIKWGVPVYTYEGKNVITVNALKHSANIGFFKGALLKDSLKILEQQGNIRSARIIRFTETAEIEKRKDILRAYILESIELEKGGKKVPKEPHSEPIPEELLEAFESDPELKSAFERLSPGRKRAYIIHISKPKQSATRKAQVLKYSDQIKAGIGLHDHYKSQNKRA